MENWTRKDIVNSACTYYGFAPIGTLPSDNKWFIKKEIVIGSGEHIIQAPSGGTLANGIWDSRTGYTYW